MAERTRELQLHTHAAGEVFDLCLGVQAKPVDVASKRFMTPRGVCRAYECLDLGHFERGREGARVQYETDAGAHAALLFIGRIGIAALPKQVHLAGIELYESECGADGRCFTGAVCAHKADNLTGFYGECDIAQRKAITYAA